MKIVSGGVAILVFLVAGTAAPSSQAAPCFVIPKSGAEYQARDNSYNSPQSVDDCATLNVHKGEVTVLYLDNNGRSQSIVVKQGTKFSPGNAANSKAPHAPLKLLAAALTKGTSSVERGGKFFDKPEDLGLPSGDVHVPAGGLTFTVRTEDGKPFAYSLEEAAASLILLKGTGAGEQPMVLPRRLFKPGTGYRLTIKFADKTATAVFLTPTVDEEKEIVDSLKQIENDSNLDTFSKAVARALIFEDRSLGYNRELALKGLVP